MVCGVVVMVEAAGLGVLAAVVLVEVAVSVVVVVESVVALVLFWLPQEAKQKRTTAQKEAERREEGFIVEDF